MKFIGTLAFAKRNVTLDHAPFDPAAYPHLVQPAEIIDREPGAYALLLMPPQKGKTLLAQLCIARNAAVHPVRTLLYSPSDVDTRAFADEKLSHLLKSLPQVQAHLPTTHDEQGGKALVRCIDAPISLLSASVLSHRNSKSGEWLYMDESWQYDPGAVKEIDARSEAPQYKWCRRIIHTMTGPTDGTEAANLWLDSSQHTWHIPCPHCGTHQTIERGKRGEPHGIRWDKTAECLDAQGQWKPTVAAKTVRWVCPSCESETRWSRDFQRRMLTDGKYIPLNPTPRSNLYGFRINAWAFDPWEELVAEWLRAVNLRKFDLSLIEEFTRKKDVRVWAESITKQGPIDYPVGDYALLDTWEHEGENRNKHPLRFMTVDVQQNHYWVLIRSWSNKPGHVGESRLRYFGKALTSGEIEDIRKAHNIQPQMVWVDSAYNSFTVAQICAKLGYRMFNGTTAKDYAHDDGVRRIYAPFRQYDAQQAGVRVSAKQMLFSSVSAKNALDAIRSYRNNDGFPIWTIANDTPISPTREDDYRAQAWAEARVKIPKKGGGFAIEWRTVFDENHAFDLEVAQVVMAAVAQCIPSEVAPADSKEDVDKQQQSSDAAAQ
jgi:predicted RNA-binding Zn-ribbon protein involved in translation (DUF1610 family)